MFTNADTNIKSSVEFSRCNLPKVEEMTAPRRNLSRWIHSVLLAGALAIICGQAAAEISKITINSTANIGPFRGKNYSEIRANIEGSAPGGAYNVPVVLAFPKNAADHNGFAVVDVINTIAVGNGLDDQWVLGPGSLLPLARLHMGDDFLFGTGHAYVGVVWDQKAVQAMKTGSVTALADGYTILRDAAELARNPAKYLAKDLGELPPSHRVIAYGYSQSGSLLRGWYYDHHNSQNGSPVFDGALIGAADGSCYDLIKPEWKACSGPLSDGGKTINFMTETDVEWGGDGERGDGPDYREIEIAGVAHIPASAADFRAKGMPEQNPMGFEPVVRAGLVNLEAWLDGKDPPPSIAMELSDVPAKDFNGAPVRAVSTDDDGNAKGGLRLPHLSSMLKSGARAGAPLGNYTGFAWKYEKSNFFFTISGTFAPYTKEKLRALYPNRESYVSLVSLAAKDLTARDYILPEDADAYIKAAAMTDIGQ